MLTIVFISILSLLCFIKLMIHGVFLIHKLQQLSYINYKFIKWLDGIKYRKILIWNLFELFIPLLFILIFYFWQEKDIKVYKTYSGVIMVTVFIWKIIHPYMAGWLGPRALVKKKLVFTSRVKRLLFSLSTIIFLSIILMIRFTAYPLDDFSLKSWSFFQFNAFILLFSIITPLFVLLANVINFPIEKMIHKIYFEKAVRKLKSSKIKRIGITGSFGKTSAKFFLSVLLAEKYKVLTTPSSFNTPMGLSKVINDSDLSAYDFFVAEMGADHKGDIHYLSKLVKPETGVITAVGIQHLETFGTPEAILKTKLELFDSIPDSGVLVYNYDSSMLKNGVLEKCYSQKILTYSAEEVHKKYVDLYADTIKHTRNGLEFCAVFKDSSSIFIKTELLGRHNVLNLLSSILVAKYYGLTNEEITRGAAKIKSVEHRLQRIDPGTGILVLDDAFNSNYTGAVEAVNVLNEISGGKKIIVTPGFVELGDEEDRYNKMFGEYMADKITHAILVGARKTNSIKDGLLNGGQSYENIYTVDSLADSRVVLAKLLKPGDVVLFENDLPDIYSEI